MTEQEETIGAGSMWCSCDCARVMQRSPALSRHYLGHGVRYSPDSVGGVDAVEALAVGELVAYQSTSRHPYVGTTWQGAVLTRLRGRLRAQVAFACGRVTTVQRSKLVRPVGSTLEAVAAQFAGWPASGFKVGAP